jgi:hypothetical protein
LSLLPPFALFLSASSLSPSFAPSLPLWLTLLAPPPSLDLNLADYTRGIAGKYIIRGIRLMGKYLPAAVLVPLAATLAVSLSSGVSLDGWAVPTAAPRSLFFSLWPKTKRRGTKATLALTDQPTNRPLLTPKPQHTPKTQQQQQQHRTNNNKNNNNNRSSSRRCCAAATWRAS